MIPISLTISGFLSYREPIEIDFTSFELACIAGSNGAGKSAILDAMTWALFGQARKRDEALINNQSDSAEVTFIFAYEGNIYRVQRTNQRGKSTLLEFHIHQDDGSITIGDQPPVYDNWKPLSERTMRETQTRVEETLRLDYETFINAAFFLQGKADQFTQQRPSDRKRILASILGLEIWETYRTRAAVSRRSVETDIANLDGRMAGINSELAEEDARVKRLKELESDLENLSQSRVIQENTLENIKKIAATLAEQRKLVQTLARQIESDTHGLDEMEKRVTARRQESDSYHQVLSRESEIKAAHSAWQQARVELARWEEVATQFREHESRRQEPLTTIETEYARLNQVFENLAARETEIKSEAAQIPDLNSQREAIKQVLVGLQAQLAEREVLQGKLEGARERLANAKAENPRLKAEMDELKNRIDQLTATDGAACPLCGQPLNAEERENLIAELNTLGTAMGDRYRANTTSLTETSQQVTDLESKIHLLSNLDDETRGQTRSLDQLNDHSERILIQQAEWEKGDALHLAETQKTLVEETYASDARGELAAIDAELKEIGYDAANHDTVRRTEAKGRSSEEEYRSLEAAQTALIHLDSEIENLSSRINDGQTELRQRELEHDQAAADLAAAEAQAPDLQQAQQELLALKEKENRHRMEVGAARQEVDVLKIQKKRLRDLEADRETKAQQVGQYKQLERAFGKDGVPALLIEQALPQIEAKANEILERLSDGNMSVRFQTQRELKTRDDLKETLDIQISDSAGLRDYEMFSGGEAFRVNFAIRLALSEVLAQRAGARLQTLVIDEGFGSQDAVGRQRLVEAINLIKPDFEKILVITHIDELKDVFPTRIEVEKTPRGSTVHVV